MISLPDSVVGHLKQIVADPDFSATKPDFTATKPDFSATKYDLISEIGRGGMGTVYAGRDTQLRRTVALKVLNILDADGQAVSRMTQEARILARLEHPGIVPIHDLGMLPDGRIFYAMKFVEGTRLDRYARGNSPLAERLRVFLRICEAAAFAHCQGVIHRDIKPENIMVGQFGEVLVLDWGVAKIIGAMRESPRAEDSPPGQTAPGASIGTPGYMAPEQASGAVEPVDARSDVYSLGRTLAALLDPAGGNCQAPKRLQAIWRKAASPDRALRYGTALELAADIERFQNGEPVQAYRENMVERAARLFAHHQTLVLLVIAYLVMRTLLFFFTRP